MSDRTAYVRCLVGNPTPSGEANILCGGPRFATAAGCRGNVHAAPPLPCLRVDAQDYVPAPPIRVALAPQVNLDVVPNHPLH